MNRSKRLVTSPRSHFLMLALAAALFGEGTASWTSRGAEQAYPSLIRLPDDQRAEGICAGIGDAFYTASLSNARILVGDIKTGTYQTLVSGQGGNGLKFDARSGLLYVCQGPAGASVFNGVTGETVAAYKFESLTNALVNDCIVTMNAVYFTDSHNALLYRVGIDANGKPETGSTSIPLPADFLWPSNAGPYNPFINANGIAVTADGKYLVLVHTGHGRLYRIDTTTHEVLRITISGGDGTEAGKGDGILLDGNTLYVVKNQNNKIAIMAMSEGYLKATITGYISEPFASDRDRLKVPTTIAKFSSGLYVVTGSLVPPGPYYVARLAGPDPVFNRPVIHDDHACLVHVKGDQGAKYDIQYSSDLSVWNVLSTVVNANDPYLTLRDPSRHWFVDSAASFAPNRFYRAVKNTDPNALAGDHLVTGNGNVVFAHPRGSHHATVLMKWGNRTIYADPATPGTNPATVFLGLPLADLIVITHLHADHFHPDTLKVLVHPTTVIVAPKTVFDLMSAELKALTVIMANGDRTEKAGVGIEAIPSYNLDPNRPFHPKGRDNGYVLTMGGKRIYIPGDTEDTPEMRALQNIDVAFLPMNLPFTMDLEHAADAARTFKPKVVYPFHFNGYPMTATGPDFSRPITSDTTRFKELVGTDAGVEVRLRRWYEPLQMSDRIPAEQSEIVIQPIHHATVLLTWNGKRIYSDPSSGGEASLNDRVALFQGAPKADLICITHFHADHFDPDVLNLLVGPNTQIAAPQSVFDRMSEPLKAVTTVMQNGKSATLAGIPIEAVPAYNLDPNSVFHPKGRDNGYVVTLGGKRLYFAGDTEDHSEMRALRNIDVAFVPMNLPFTMTAHRAADAVRQFKPRIVYPYHFVHATGGISEDVRRFKRLVGTDLGIDVRLRQFYTSVQ